MNFNMDKLKELTKKPIKFSLKKQEKNLYKEDINFFEPLFINKKAVRGNSLTVLVIAIVAVVAMLGYSSYSYIRVRLLEDSIETMQKQMTSGSIQTKVNLSKKLLKEYEILQNYKTEIDKIDKTISKEQRIKSSLIEDISKKISKGVSFQTMATDGNTLVIAGTADTRVSIADFEHNLKTLAYLEKIYIPSITTNAINGLTAIGRSNKKYSFSINCNLKDVDLNENN